MAICKCNILRCFNGKIEINSLEIVLHCNCCLGLTGEHQGLLRDRFGHGPGHLHPPGPGGIQSRGQSAYSY